MSLKYQSRGRSPVPKATREFSHSLYRTAALEETQQAYGEILRVAFEHTEGNTLATFENDDDDLTFYVDAFCNHALFLTIQQYREGIAT